MNLFVWSEIRAIDQLQQAAQRAGKDGKWTMNSVDWNAKATLQQRDDAGSDMFVAFDTIGEGTLGEMVARVMTMAPHDRARVVLDVAGRGMLDVGQVAELSRREDFPGR